MSIDSRVENLLSNALGLDVSRLIHDSLVSELRVNADGELWVNRLGEGKSLVGAIIPPERVKQAIYTVAYTVNA